METKNNPQLEQAAAFVRDTGRNIFLTGRAGTGKTTFLRSLRNLTPKRFVVVAPTGVAAINAGGVTIHSFFQIGFGPLPPGTPVHRDPSSPTGNTRKFHREKIRLIKSLDLLVIDEISMVRADLLDAVDRVLREFRDRSRPFGGVQLLMIGDLLQLPPVVRDADRDILREFYSSFWFFDSLALKQTGMVTIELEEVFRQTDRHFLDLLNRVRDDTADTAVLEALNARHQSLPETATGPAVPDGYIMLTTHNAGAAAINKAGMDALKSEPKLFRAVVEGDFAQGDFPTAEELELKTGAQVMFVKNDPSAEKAYYNGKIGKVTRIAEESVWVECPGDAEPVETKPVTWSSIRYSLDPQSREVKEEIAGTFTQVPLKPAWAITIHKSQGLTFDRVVIDARAAFASGQVYVALSRCRTLEGIILSTPVIASGIRSDALVQRYTREVRENRPGAEFLEAARREYQGGLLRDLFDLRPLGRRFDALLRLVQGSRESLDAGDIRWLSELRNTADTDLLQVSGRFRAQLEELLQSPLLPAANPPLLDRVTKAAGYFLPHLRALDEALADAERLETDNRAVAKTIADSMEKLRRELAIRAAGIAACSRTFEPPAVLRARGDADINFKMTEKRRAKSTETAQTGDGKERPGLHEALKQWRDAKARDEGVRVYMILPVHSIRGIVHLMPLTLRDLKEIKGLGPARINRYGKEILNVIHGWLAEHPDRDPDGNNPGIDG